MDMQETQFESIWTLRRFRPFPKWGNNHIHLLDFNQPDVAGVSWLCVDVCCLFSSVLCSRCKRLLHKLFKQNVNQSVCTSFTSCSIYHQFMIFCVRHCSHVLFIYLHPRSDANALIAHPESKGGWQPLQDCHVDWEPCYLLLACFQPLHDCIDMWHWRARFRMLLILLYVSLLVPTIEPQAS